VRSGFRTDPLLLEILRNRFKAVAEAMAAATLRTAYTVFVKEKADDLARLRACLRKRSMAPSREEARDLLAGLCRDLGLEPRPALIGVGGGER
jgi:N-methylhydantoinase B